jgi:hypothetical protein
MLVSKITNGGWFRYISVSITPDVDSIYYMDFKKLWPKNRIGFEWWSQGINR